jgi:hypothetical protein
MTRRARCCALLDRASLNAPGRLALPMLDLLCAMPVTFVHWSASDVAKSVLVCGKVSRLYLFCPRCQVLDFPSKSVSRIAEPA